MPAEITELSGSWAAFCDFIDPRPQIRQRNYSGAKSMRSIHLWAPGCRRRIQYYKLPCGRWCIDRTGRLTSTLRHADHAPRSRQSRRAAQYHQTGSHARDPEHSL